MRSMIKKIWSKVPEGVREFLLARVLLGLMVWLLAIVTVIVGCVAAVAAMIIAIFDPLRGADVIHRFGEELVK